MPRILTPSDVAQFRNRLCDVAADLFSEQGQSGFNMRELAKRLGVSAMTPYRYFQDKNAILAEVRARAFAQFADYLEDALAIDDESGTTLAKRYAQFAIQEQTRYRLMFDLTQPTTASSPLLAAQERRARAALVSHARRMVERRILAGDPELLGLLLWSVLHGAAALYLTGKLSEEDFRLALSNAVRLVANDPLHAAPHAASAIRDLDSATPSLDAITSNWSASASYQPVAVAGE